MVTVDSLELVKNELAVRIWNLTGLSRRLSELGLRW
jgi:hypothetical protein